jgi:hypothetical protein
LVYLCTKIDHKIKNHNMKKKIKFILSADVVAGAEEGLLLGEFNNWTKEEGFSLKRSKDGSFQATVALEAGRSYQYRYLLSDGRWVNDSNALQYVHDAYFQVENCLVSVPAELDSPVKEKKTAVKAGSSGKRSAKVNGQVVDDLTLIEGVGKKIAEILTSLGISSFEALAKSKVTFLREALDAAGPRYRVHEPATWPRQAKLAAAGKFDELKKLQAELKGGK